MIIVNVHHRRITAGKQSETYPRLKINYFLSNKCILFVSRRGRGSYRGRGRGNFYRQERGGGSHQMHGSMHQQAPNMQPYYNQPANQMHPNTGVGYHDANYHDMQANRYEMFNKFTTKFKYHVNEKQKYQQQGQTNAIHSLDCNSVILLILVVKLILSRDVSVLRARIKHFVLCI